jgi:hypothetical protein
MRPIYQTVGAVAAGPWISLDYIESWFGCGLAVTLSEDAVGITYSVDCTYDDLGITAQRPVSISRTGTVATATDLGPGGAQYQYSLIQAHGLITGDSVVITGSGSTNLDGTYAVASTPSATTYTYTVGNTGATADNGNARVNALRVFSVTGLSAQTVRAQGSVIAPVKAVRLRISAWTAGQATLAVLQGKS